MELLSLLVLHQIVKYTLSLFVFTLTPWVWNRVYGGRVDGFCEIFVLWLAKVTRKVVGLRRHLGIYASQFPLLIVQACQIVIILRFLHLLKHLIIHFLID